MQKKKKKPKEKYLFRYRDRVFKNFFLKILFNLAN